MDQIVVKLIVISIKYKEVISNHNSNKYKENISSSSSYNIKISKD